MKNVYLPLTTLALVAATLSGCGGAAGDDAARLGGAAPSQEQGPLSVTAPSQRLYFGVTEHVHVGGDTLTEISLNAGAEVELEVATADSSPLRFEIWQAHAGSTGTPAGGGEGAQWVELLNAFDVQSGFVLTSFSAPSDGLYLVHFPAPSSPRDVNLHMDCNRTSGRCTAELQPGERCFEQTACSPGLACAPNDGACDPIWAGGTCVVPGDDTACVGLPEALVCGCDGETYANECSALASGKGMKTSGSCPATSPG